MLVSDDLDAGETIVVQKGSESLGNRDFLSSSEDASRVGWVVIVGFVLIKSWEVNGNGRIQCDGDTHLNADSVDGETFCAERLNGLEKIAGVCPRKLQHQYFIHYTATKDTHT